MDLVIILLYILFVIAAIVLIVVVLLQEGKGGGFGEALGVHGRETFGVGAKGINTFTGVTATIFLGSALLIHVLNRSVSQGSVIDTTPGAGSSLFDQQPTEPGATPPPTGGEQPVAPPAGEKK
ncbi:MAG: preprotein translocase subunit SecG [Planctomycetes bacterium]|nr:preprotein translocase subunit SecG [Planctomycetota bacterium]